MTERKFACRQQDAQVRDQWSTIIKRATDYLS